MFYPLRNRHTCEISIKWLIKQDHTMTSMPIWMREILQCYASRGRAIGNHWLLRVGKINPKGGYPIINVQP